MRIAVLGVGLIGGSIGLAAKRRLGAKVSGFDPDADARERALERDTVDRGDRHDRRGGRRCRGGLLRCARRSSSGTGLRGALSKWRADGGHRRWLHQGGAGGRGARAARGALHRRAPAGRRRDRRGRERARGPVRGGALVPDAHRALQRPPVRPAPACDRRPRRPSPGDRRRRPRPADGDRQPPSARDRQRAGSAGGCGGGRGVRAPARGWSELPRHNPGRGGEPSGVGRHLRHQPRGGGARGR